MLDVSNAFRETESAPGPAIKPRYNLCAPLKTNNDGQGCKLVSNDVSADDFDNANPLGVIFLKMLMTFPNAGNSRLDRNSMQ
ncbi:MAG: hypothetical protein A2W25_07160 [candidate division Zixibacteria bacterium RBG_16_53_22]|nr:MAG: hypothetical protein A2W25_07160 [candidate division Zixibacteria bacterium RBG_16_53_22]